MKTRTIASSQGSNRRFRCLALAGALTAVLPLAALAGSTAGSDAVKGHDHHAPARLVSIVRDATRQFIDFHSAMSAGYQPFLGCVSGPDHGAMGVHYVNGTLVGDGEIDGSHPEALIYETRGGRVRLVGVEFIVDSATWLKNHDTPPVLEGQSFQLVASPNRYGLPAFFELHVWAWRDNPNGAFVDWNTQVTCEGR